MVAEQKEAEPRYSDKLKIAQLGKQMSIWRGGEERIPKIYNILRLRGRTSNSSIKNHVMLRRRRGETQALF